MWCTEPSWTKANLIKNENVSSHCCRSNACLSERSKAEYVRIELRVQNRNLNQLNSSRILRKCPKKQLIPLFCYPTMQYSSVPKSFAYFANKRHSSVYIVATSSVLEMLLLLKVCLSRCWPLSLGSSTRLAIAIWMILTHFLVCNFSFLLILGCTMSYLPM